MQVCNCQSLGECTREKALCKMMVWGEQMLGDVLRRVDQKHAVRSEVSEFAVLMEQKLRKNDHKTAWRNLPIEALFRQFLLELEEFKVADEFLTVADARQELVDLANFALILHDRLGMLAQDANRHTQSPSLHHA